MSDQTQPTNAAPSRDDLRAAIFSNKVQRYQATFQGSAIEIIQPSIGAIIAMRKETGDDDQAVVIKSLIDYAVVPGSDERVFEETDYDGLMALPFTTELKDIMEKITQSAGLDAKTKEQEKN